MKLKDTIKAALAISATMGGPTACCASNPLTLPATPENEGAWRVEGLRGRVQVIFCTLEEATGYEEMQNRIRMLPISKECYITENTPVEPLSYSSSYTQSCMSALVDLRNCKSR